MNERTPRPLGAVLVHAGETVECPMRIAGDLQRAVPFAASIPVPPRLGPGPWWMTARCENNGVLAVVDPDAFEVTVTVRLRRAR